MQNRISCMFMFMHWELASIWSQQNNTYSLSKIYFTNYISWRRGRDEAFFTALLLFLRQSRSHTSSQAHHLQWKYCDLLLTSLSHWYLVHGYQIKEVNTAFLCVQLLFSTCTLLIGLMWLHVTPLPDLCGSLVLIAQTRLLFWLQHDTAHHLFIL